MSLESPGRNGWNTLIGQVIVTGIVVGVSFGGGAPAIDHAIGGELSCGCEVAGECGEPACGCEEPVCGFEPSISIAQLSPCGPDGTQCGCEANQCGCEASQCGCEAKKKNKLMTKLGSMRTKFTSLFNRDRDGDESCDDGCDAMMIEELSHPYSSDPIYSESPMYSSGPVYSSDSLQDQVMEPHVMQVQPMYSQPVHGQPMQSQTTQGQPMRDQPMRDPRVIPAPTPPKDSNGSRRNGGVVVPDPIQMQNEPQPLRNAPTAPRSDDRPDEMEDLFDNSNDPFADEEASLRPLRRIRPASYRH